MADYTQNPIKYFILDPGRPGYEQVVASGTNQDTMWGAYGSYQAVDLATAQQYAQSHPNAIVQGVGLAGMNVDRNTLLSWTPQTVPQSGIVASANVGGQQLTNVPLSTIQKEEANQAAVAAGTMKNIGTTAAPQYVPTGSAADLLKTNPDEYYRQHPEDKPSTPTAVPTPPPETPLPTGVSQAAVTPSGTTGPAAPTGVTGGGTTQTPTSGQAGVGQPGFTQFVKTKDNDTVYGITSNGTVVAFQTPEQFLGAGGNWNNIQTVTSAPSNAVVYSDYVKTISPAGGATTFDPATWGIDTSLWNSLDDGTKAFIESSAKLIQDQYNQGMANASVNADLLNKAMTAAQTDPDILAKYSDAAIMNVADLKNNLSYINAEYAQSQGITAAQQEQERKQLAETEADAGRAYSGFREQAKGLLAQQQTGVIESARRTLQQQVRTAGEAYETAYGTPATQALGTLAAGGETYQPIGGLTGTVPLQKKTDIYNRGLQIYQSEASPLA